MFNFFSAVGNFIVTLLWLAFFALAVLAIIAFMGYNKLRQLSESVKEKWSNVTVVQRKQVSLINQLLDVTKGYQESEKLIMLKVSEDASSVASVAQMYQQSGAVLSTVSGVAHKFPELKSNQQYKRLIDSIQNCEKELEDVRQQFNASVKAYNVHRSSIPHVFYSSTLGFKAAAYLEFTSVGQSTDMGALATFSSDVDGERLNQILSAASNKAIEFSNKAIDSGRAMTTKAVENGKVLAAQAQGRFRDLSETESNPSLLAVPPASNSSATESYYYLDENNRHYGPFSLSELKEKVTTGHLGEGVMVAAAGEKQWRAIKTL